MKSDFSTTLEDLEIEYGKEISFSCSVNDEAIDVSWFIGKEEMVKNILFKFQIILQIESELYLKWNNLIKNFF